MNLPERTQKTAAGFVANLRECFGDALLSVVLYGPAARGEQAKDGPAMTFLVVVRDSTPSELAPCSAFVRRWERSGIATPLFLTPEYIRASLDSFPLEFMEMQRSGVVLAGEDFLHGAEFAARDIRAECEREIKGKLLHLRAEYLALRGNRKDVAGLAARSLATFRRVFAGALSLRNVPAPEEMTGLLATAAAEYGLDGEFLREIHAVARGESKPDPAAADHLFDRYVEELDTLSTAIDAFRLPEESHE